MKILGNEAKIGDAALLSFFKPYKNNRWERKTTLHKEEVDLQKLHPLDGQKADFLKLWGISPGLKDIDIPRLEKGSILDFISKNINTVEEIGKFSHFVIIREWSGKAPYVFPDTETVEIYRLSPSCKKLIMINWDWLEIN